MRVQRRLRDAGLLDHPLNADRPSALAIEQLRRGRDQTSFDAERRPRTAGGGATGKAGDGRLRINSGGIVAKFGGELTDADWMTAARDEFEVNVLGALSVTQAFAPALTGRAGAAVANISSVAGLVAFPFLASYSASKAALHSLTPATRALLAPNGVHGVGVYPGPIDTDLAKPFEMVKTAPEAAANAILDGLEEGREEIFPDPMAREVGELFLRDPRALERQFAATATPTKA